MKNIYFILLMALGFTRISRADCQKWFDQSEISISDTSCLPKCAALMTDMGTFGCPMQCDQLCLAPLKEQLLFQYAYYPALTPQERALIAKYPTEALKVYQQMRETEKITSRLFPKGFVDDESDAVRHFIWAGLLVRELGSDKAQMFLDAHEANARQTDEAKSMDVKNNLAGIHEAERLKKSGKLNAQSIEKAAVKFLMEKRLIVVKPRGTLPMGALK